MSRGGTFPGPGFSFLCVARDSVLTVLANKVSEYLSSQKPRIEDWNYKVNKPQSQESRIWEQTCRNDKVRNHEVSKHKLEVKDGITKLGK